MRVPDLGQFLPAGVFAGSQGCNPPASRGAQLFQSKPAVSFREAVELFEPGLKQRLCPGAIPAGVVMERRRDLDDALQKSSLGLRGGQPDLLPGLVGLKKPTLVELVEPLPEFFFLFSLVRSRHLVGRVCEGAEPGIIANSFARKAPGGTMHITIDLPGVQLGVIEAEQVRVAPAGAELAREMDTTCECLRRALSLEQVAELESIGGVRAMFRTWGVDPSRYRPSAEALLRRVVQGKGLYRVSNVVDISNLGSIETGWPYGSYNREAIEPPVVLRLGLAGEKYEGIGKQVWHLARRPVLADQRGPFGSPISDSTRTMIREGVVAWLTVIFAPGSSDRQALEQAI